MSASDPDYLRRLCENFARLIPHVGVLGVEMMTVEAKQVIARLPFRPEFLGDAERGLIHTGGVTSLIDSACGIAVMACIGHSEVIATLDLRVDYLRASLPAADLVCRAECYRLTEQIAFVRTSVWQDDETRPVASSLATFMRGNSERGRIL